MRVRASVKKIDTAPPVRRKGRLYIINKLPERPTDYPLDAEKHADARKVEDV